MDVWCEIKG